MREAPPECSASQEEAETVAPEASVEGEHLEEVATLAASLGIMSPREPDAAMPEVPREAEMQAGSDPPSKKAKLDIISSTASADGGSSTVGPDERERLLARLASATSRISDLEQLAEAVGLVERLTEERLARQPLLLKQLAFYFSDANLRRDRFLRAKIEEDADATGYVPVTTFLPFNRIKEIGCTTAGEIAAAAAGAPADLGIELSPGHDRLRRTGGASLPPLASVGAWAGGDAATEKGSPQDRRSVHIQGFAKGDEDVTIDTISELLKPYGVVSYVRLLRDRAAPGQSTSCRQFLGSAEVEFTTEAGAATAASAQPSPIWRGTSLHVKPLLEYRAECNERRIAGKRPNEDAEEDSKAKRKRMEDEAVAVALTRDRGLILRLDEIPEGVTWKDIRDALSIYGHVAFVDVRVNDGNLATTRAYVRMRAQDGVAAALAAIRDADGFLSVWPRSRRGDSWQIGSGVTEEAGAPEAEATTELPEEAEAAAVSEDNASAIGKSAAVVDNDVATQLAPVPAESATGAKDAHATCDALDEAAMDSHALEGADQDLAQAKARVDSGSGAEPLSNVIDVTTEHINVVKVPTPVAIADVAGQTQEATTNPLECRDECESVEVAVSDPYGDEFVVEVSHNRATCDAQGEATAFVEAATNLRKNSEDSAQDVPAVAAGEKDTKREGISPLPADTQAAVAAHSISDDGATASTEPVASPAKPLDAMVRIPAIHLAGEEEKAYLQKAAIAIVERWAAGGGKGGKGGKGKNDNFKGGKGDKGGKSWKFDKGGKAWKDGKGRNGEKGSRDGKKGRGK